MIAVPDGNGRDCTAILFALALEARPTLRQLRESQPLRLQYSRGRSGVLGDSRLHVAVIGAAGEVLAAKAAAEIIEQIAPSRVVSVGFAGGLTEGLFVGDPVLPQSVCNERGVELPLASWTTGQLQDFESAHRGRLISVPQFIGDVSEKRALAAEHAALACDMETWAIADVCRRSHTPLHSVRIISDSLTDEFPRELPQLLAAQSFAQQALTAADSVLRRPTLARDLWRLERTARNVAAKLADHLATLVRRIPSILRDANTATFSPPY